MADEQNQKGTGQGDQNQTSAQTGGGSPSWEDALGALVEQNAPQTPQIPKPVSPQPVVSSQTSPQTTGGQPAPGGVFPGQDAQFKKKKRRRRKKKKFQFPQGEVRQFEPVLPNQPQIKPQPPKFEEQKNIPPAAEEKPPMPEPTTASTVTSTPPAGAGGAHPTWEEAMMSMADDFKPEEKSKDLPKKEEKEYKPWEEEASKNEPVESVFPDEPEMPVEEMPQEEVREEAPEEPVIEEEGEIVSETPGEEIEMLEEEEEVKSNKKYFYIGLGFVIIVAAIIVAGFFVVKKFVLKDKEIEEETVAIEETVVPAEEIEVETSEEKLETPQAEAILQPLDRPFLMPGLAPSFTAVSRAGQTASPQGRFIYYVDTVKRLKILYDMDLQKLLNQSTDRRSALDAYLGALKSIQTEALTTLEHVIAEQTQLAANFDTVTKQKDDAEQIFFNELQQLNAILADESLSEFTQLIRRHSSIRARHRALANVRGFYERALPKLDARIRDISANTEPLVKGLKVVDIEQSDLGLIIQEK